MREAKFGKGCIRLYFKGLDFEETKEKVKALPGRKFVPALKAWEVPLTEDILDRIESIGFSLDKPLKAWKNKEARNGKDIAIDNRLFEFQKQGVRKIEKWNGRAMLGDEMGLGKTYQALAWLAARPDMRPAIIAVPATLKMNWVKHCLNILPENELVYMLSGKNNKEFRHWIVGQGEQHTMTIRQKSVIVVNYDILGDWERMLIGIEPRVFIPDEAHYIKNMKAKRTKAARRIGRRCESVIPLTGTPIENRPAEFFSPLNLVRPDLFPAFFPFAQRYCAAVKGYWGWDFSGSSNTDELHDLLVNNLLIRRKKEDVLKELPPKSKAVVPIEPTKATLKEYRRAESDISQWVLEKHGDEKALRAARAEAITKVNYLKRLSFDCKSGGVIQWIQDFLESGEKLVVFATHHEVIDRLMEEFGPAAVKIDGRTPTNERQTATERFQNEAKVRLFIGNIKAAGVGIDLHAASNVAFVELGWTPGEHDQAEDRCHRIGQKSDSVTAWYLVAQGTIEEEIVATLDEKRQVISQIMDGEETENETLLSEILKKLKGE